MLVSVFISVFMLVSNLVVVVDYAVLKIPKAWVLLLLWFLLLSLTLMVMVAGEGEVGWG
jgi:hypothetical protein